MKKLTKLIAAAAMLTGLSVAQGAPFAVEGNWGMQQQDNGFTFDMTFMIQNNTVTLVNVCTYRGQSATARVTVPAQYDGSTLAILAGARDEQRNGDVTCEASASIDRMNYEVRGNSLVFTKPGQPGELVLGRR